MKRRDLLKAAAGAAAALSALPLRWVSAGQKKTPKLLFFTGSAGFEHSVVRRDKGQLSHAEKVLTEMGKRAGFEVECSKDGSVFDGNLGPYDAVAFYTCGDLTQPDAYNTRPMTSRGKQKLLTAIAGGKGFIGFHSAADTFHSPAPDKKGAAELDPYVAMLGGEFVSHGAQQEASLIIASRFPGAGDIGCSEGISFTDEWYALKNFAKDLHVVLVQETRFMKGECYQRPDFPATWARMHGKGRVFYTSLGHREDVWTNPFFQAIALGGLEWALGRGNPNVAPNIAKVTPHANQLRN
jgi:type 1 glutamine amidotransferase